MPNLKALLFDVDGTLADTERDGHRVAFNLAFQDAHLDWQWSESFYGELLAITGGKQRLRYYLQHYQTSLSPPTGIENFIATLYEVKNQHYIKLLTQGHISLRIGVARLLKEARTAGLKLGIATTSAVENVTALLTRTLGPNAKTWFDVIATGECVPALKPAPDVYFYAMEKMKLTAGECMAFEDSENGLHAATAAGLKTIITVNEYTRDQDFTAAVAVLDSLGDPQHPLKVISGTCGSATYLTMEQIRSIHARHHVLGKPM